MTTTETDHFDTPSERAGTKYVPGKNPQPRNGRVIGHIIEDKFVPIVKKITNKPEMLSYGAAALVKSLTHDLLSDLLNIYPPQDATRLWQSQHYE
jgi:hypothetical protein